MDRLCTVLDQTKAAWRLNSEHLNDRAKELNQLADRAQAIRKFMMPDGEAYQDMMDHLYDPEE